MKRILTLCLFLALTTVVRAQTIGAVVDSLRPSAFVQALTQAGDTVVRLGGDARILELIGNPGVTTPENLVLIEDRLFVQMSGYRIQVFAGNNAQTAKDEAFRKEAAVKAAVPELTCYVRYSAPFWRLRVGDFLTYEDAYQMLLRFRREFVYGREMSIVRERINVAL